jgi:hypothetical protein
MLPWIFASEVCAISTCNHRQIFGLLDDDGKFPGPVVNEMLRPLTHKREDSNTPDYADKPFKELLKKESKEKAKEDEEGEDLEKKEEEVETEEDLLDKQRRVSMRLKAMFPGGLPGQEEDQGSEAGEQDADDEELSALRHLEDDLEEEGDGDNCENADRDISLLENDVTTPSKSQLLMLD